MEAVKLFNQEVRKLVDSKMCQNLFTGIFFQLQLSSLYEIKPPISKAKMTAITKGAIRAIKYYKHVVQSDVY